MNILDIYSYSDKPGISTSPVQIFPLNDEGLKTYLFKKESLVSNYLNKFNSKLLQLNESTTPSNDNNPQSVSSLQQPPSPIQANENSPLNNKVLFKRKLNPLNTKSKLKLLSKSMDTISKQQDDYYKNILYNKKPNALDNTNIHFQKIQNCIIKHRKKKQLELPEEKNNNQQDEYKPLEPLKLNKYFKQFHKDMSFENVYGYPLPLNKKTRGNVYNNEISFLKANMKSSIDYNNDKNDMICRRNVKNNKMKHSQSFMVYENRINNSMKLSEENKGDKFKNKNEEMIWKLTEQTSKEYLKKNKLPDIRKIANGSIVIREAKDYFSKELGEKYNPYNYVLTKPRIKERNYNGALFNH